MSSADELELRPGEEAEPPRAAADDAHERDFDDLLGYLQRARGFDFTGYKRQGLMRRIEKRMGMVGVPTFAAYVDYLEVHPDEFAQLFNTILINVTSFMRDAPVWDYLRAEVVPRILEEKAAHDQVRAWSAGCSSGEEAYSLAIIFAESMGYDAACDRVKIYATDVDEDALAQARLATYGAREVAGLSRELIGKYFDHANGGDRYQFKKELRRCVIFGRHDLLTDAPISKVDLLMSRNTLMYFNAESQTRILTRFHFALADTGYLVLGKAETMLTRANLFKPVDLRRRVFAKVPKLNLRDRLLVLAQNNVYEPPVAPVDNERLREVSFEAAPAAHVVIDADGSLVLANLRARELLKLGERDLGRPLQDLEMSFRPVEMRSLIEKAQDQRRAVVLREVEWPAAVPAVDRAYFDIQVTPLYDAPATMIGVAVTYNDVTAQRRLNDELQRSQQEREAAYEELQSTSEELETTNEELQSTVEELETTNEELQSTNEELETMNEELQSTNEELQTINDELRQRTDELGQVNAFMNSILSSLRTGVVVVDRELRVMAWNARAEDLWGLREDEVQGKFVMNLDIGLPVDRLRGPLRECLAGDGDGELNAITVPATNRRGKKIDCRVACSPLLGSAKDRCGVILLMEERDGKAGRDESGGDGK
jgi:two-component system CheB/CheR fusion protein